MIFTPAYATGTTYAKFDNFCLYSFLFSFKQAITRVCTYYRTRKQRDGRSVSTLTSDLIVCDSYRLNKVRVPIHIRNVADTAGDLIPGGLNCVRL